MGGAGGRDPRGERRDLRGESSSLRADGCGWAGPDRMGGMTSRLRRIAPALALALALAAAAALQAAPPAAAGGAIPELEVEAPERYAGLARRLRELEPAGLATVASLVGIEEPGPPIRVLLAPEGSPLASAVPPWVSGYASGQGVVVLMPSRTPTYPDSSIEELLRHEVAHVLINRAAGGQPLPRWFHEGVATVAGTSWGLDDRSYLTLALLRDEEIPLPELERRFGGSEGEARSAYAVSGAFVRDLVQRRGPEVVARILAGVRVGLPFEDAFARAAGDSLGAAEASFWRGYSFWYRWVPLLTSSVTLWLAITLLALVAIRRRRARDAALRQRWEEEEAEAERLRLPAGSGSDEGWGPN